MYMLPVKDNFRPFRKIFRGPLPAARPTARPVHGDERDRTADLLVANQPLSQLSYVPRPIQSRFCPGWRFVAMGLVGVEPTTLPLSGARSNQLSYKPNVSEA